MKANALLDQFKQPETVENVLELARVASGIQVAASPRITVNPVEAGRPHPSFRLDAVYTLKAGDRTATFEQTYAKGHETQPAKSAANGFLIANTRLQRDLKRLRQAGVRCDAVPFVLSELLPGVDLNEFEPCRPYTIGQFAILAGIGVPVSVAMTTSFKKVTLKDGRPGLELCAHYTFRLRGREYQVESHHGRFAEGAGQAEVDRLRKEALDYLHTEEQHNLRRVGVEIEMGPLWPDEKATGPRLAAVGPQPSGQPGKPVKSSLGAA